MNEKEVEGCFKNWLNNQNLKWKDQVEIDENVADFVYEDEDSSLVSIEAKGESKDGILKGFSQAVTYMKGTHLAYLLIPEKAIEGVDNQLVKRTGVGILSVNNNGEINEVYPSERQSPQASICEKIRAELREVEERREKVSIFRKQLNPRERIMEVLRKYEALTSKEIKEKLNMSGDVDAHLRTLIVRGEVQELGKKKKEGLSAAVWPRVYAPAGIDKNDLEKELGIKFWPERGSIDLIPEILDSPMKTREIWEKLRDEGYELKSQSSVYNALKELEKEGAVVQKFSEKGRNAIWIKSEDKEKYKDLGPRDVEQEIVDLLKKESPKQVKEIADETGWSKPRVQRAIKSLLEEEKIYVPGKRENYNLYAHPHWHGILREDFLSEVQEKILECLKNGESQSTFDISKKLGGVYEYDTMKINAKKLEEKGYIQKAGTKKYYQLYKLKEKGREYLNTSKVSSV